MKSIHFHAVKEDILQVISVFESGGSVKYVLTGNFLANEISEGISVYESVDEIPNLGEATADSSAACESFLVCDQTTPITPRSLQESGRVCIDQLFNPDTVVFKPGGIWSEEVLLEGQVGTASDSDESQRLMKRFNSAIKKTFTKVKAFYVGPKALELLERGTRLTMSAHSSHEFDLTPVSTE